MNDLFYPGCERIYLREDTFASELRRTKQRNNKVPQTEVSCNGAKGSMPSVCREASLPFLFGRDVTDHDDRIQDDAHHSDAASWGVLMRE